jgi:hypothetical protein
MSDGDTMAQLAVVILLLALAVPSLATAYDYAGTPIEYEETVSVDYSNNTGVSESATLEDYADETTVTADGTELVEGTDYRWDEESGSVDWLDTANSSDGDEAVIQYRAHQRTAETEIAWTVISPIFGLFGLFAVVASVRTLWSYIVEVFDR